jgi:hypothetical protein
MHIRFDDLPSGRRPRSESADFSKAWRSDAAGVDFLKEGIRLARAEPRSKQKID